MRNPARIRDFARNQAGTILVFWGIALGVILGIVALSFDLGRASITRSELQSFADSVALAAAGELDGNSDAIVRATAAANLIRDSQSFGNTSRILEGQASFTLTFFSSLPANDTSAMTAVTTDPARAAFVRVTVTPTVVESTFGAAFAALTNRQNRDFNLGATAVAGLSTYACDITPMMFCLPSPNYSAKDNIGKMVLLRRGGNGAAWGPGDFGFLDPTGMKIDPTGPCAKEKGAQLLACLVGAVDHITQCFNQRGVDMEPGQKVGLEDAFFNVRFDIYQSIMNGKRNDPDYAPAPNVIKGMRPRSGGGGGGGGAGCNLEPNLLPDGTPETLALPRDDCMPACGRFGDGDWTAGRARYVAANYGGVDPHPPEETQTRYEYYLAELARAGSGPILTGRRENGLPTCSTRPPAPPDRRIITVAGIDCAANGIRGSASNVPVKEFFKIFLTEPVVDFQIYGEIVGSASFAGEGGQDIGGLVRDVVQLYR
ncbi:pilus assembly protein TadG-related protein [Tabrizicola caldifontis]|uniref:pilus assembly protein TadG-related protein n=1 Tax=Tabrizicola caldifontis TaxID=2528036 RepID=UPI0010816581|nr:TadE/TadG family type IV pilus assembly protein [Rhodobacter sp. YIM 73028]